MQLSAQQLKELQLALIDAFPNTTSLERMLLFELGKNLKTIAGEGSLEDMVFQLIQTAISQGWVKNLVGAACNSNPGNPRLMAIARGLLPDHDPETSSVFSPNIPQIQVIRKMVLIKQICLWGSLASIIGMGGFALYSFFAQTETPSISNGTSYGNNSTAIGNNTGTVNINSGNITKSELPKFEGEFGHLEHSNRFFNFIFDNQLKIVYIDAYYIDSDYPSNDLIQKNNGIVNSFTIWNSCESLAPNEIPSYTKCLSTYFTLDRSGQNKDKDSDITYTRGNLLIQGYFSIQGCSGPYTGTIGCRLRPLNPEEVR